MKAKSMLLEQLVSKRTRPRDKQGRAWAEANRAACIAYAKESEMGRLGFSHAATEYLVMKRQMADHFTQWGMHVVCLKPLDPWR